MQASKSSGATIVTKDGRRLKLIAVPVRRDATPHNNPINKASHLRKFDLSSCNLTPSLIQIGNKEIERNINKVLKCEHCLYTTKEEYFMKIHKFCKHEESLVENKTDLFACNNVLDLYKCRICDFTTYFQVSLKNHILKAHKAPFLNFSIESYTCSICKFQTFSLLILYKHVCTNEINMMESNNKVYQCTLCKFKTNKSSQLKRHFGRRHPSGTLFKCDRCKYTFVERTHLERHLKRHSTGLFYCDFCDFKTNFSSNLNVHMRIKHEDDDKIKWFRCEHCDYKSKAKSSMKAHMKSIHSGKGNVKWFKCKDCEYKTLAITNLEKHSLEQHGRHISEWFNCEYCGFRSKQRRGVWLHTRRQHAQADSQSTSLTNFKRNQIFNFHY